jgi:hypothetical protein
MISCEGEQPMAEMTQFEWGWFDDQPRCISFRYRGRLFVLQSRFDDDLEEYPDEYSVYVVPDSIDDSQPICTPEFLSKTPMACIGQIPVNQVTFDPSKRKELDASILDSLIADNELGTS